MNHQWKPIESAPKDGTEIWTYNGEQARMRWTEGDCYALWIWADDMLSDVDPSPEQPTHWMPLPAAPRLTCNDQGAVGNILTAEPCPDCSTPPASAQDDAKDWGAAFDAWFSKHGARAGLTYEEIFSAGWRARPAPAAGDAREKLHAFLDAAAGEGMILGDIDAQELYIAVFPDRYAASQQQEG